MQSTRTKPAAKSARMSKVKKLELEAQAQAARIEQLTIQNQELSQTVKARDAHERHQAERIAAMESDRTRMLAALKPFFDHTRDWDGQWPGDNIAVTRRLTFGHLKTARDTYVAVSK